VLLFSVAARTTYTRSKSVCQSVVAKTVQSVVRLFSTSLTSEELATYLSHTDGGSVGRSIDVNHKLF